MEGSCLSFTTSLVPATTDLSTLCRKLAKCLTRPKRGCVISSKMLHKKRDTISEFNLGVSNARIMDRSNTDRSIYTDLTQPNLLSTAVFLQCIHKHYNRSHSLLLLFASPLYGLGSKIVTSLLHLRPSEAHN